MAIGADCDGVGVQIITLTVPNEIGFINFWALFFSVVAYAGIADMFFAMFFTQRIGVTVLILFTMVFVGLNQFVFKLITEEPRPSTSCLTDGGFPSGHAMFATIFLVWLTIEFIQHPGWSWKKKGLSLLGVWIVFGLVPPARHPGGDHSWYQIGFGVVTGVIAAILIFVVSQFVVVRYLEFIMKLKPVRWLRLQNDYRPHWEQTKYKGAKAPTTFPKPLFSIPLNDTDDLFNGAHCAVMSVCLVVGIAGIIIGIVKPHIYECNQSAGTMTIGIGLWTTIVGFHVAGIWYNVWRRRQGRKYYSDVTQALLFSGGLFMFEGFFWSVATVEVSRKVENCPVDGIYHNITLIYAVIWVVLWAITLMFGISMYVVLALRTQYGTPTGVSQNKQIEDTPETPMDEKVTTPLAPRIHSPSLRKPDEVRTPSLDKVPGSPSSPTTLMTTASPKKSPAITKAGSIIRSRSKTVNDAV